MIGNAEGSRPPSKSDTMAASLSVLGGPHPGAEVERAVRTPGTHERNVAGDLNLKTRLCDRPGGSHCADCQCSARGVDVDSQPRPRLCEEFSAAKRLDQGVVLVGPIHSRGHSGLPHRPFSLVRGGPSSHRPPAREESQRGMGGNDKR